MNDKARKALETHLLSVTEPFPGIHYDKVYESVEFAGEVVEDSAIVFAFGAGVGEEVG